MLREVRNIRLAVLIAVFVLVANAQAKNFTSTSLDAGVSVGEVYNIDLFSNDTFNFTVPCLIAAKDRFSNPIKSWTVDPNYNSIRINYDGHVKSYVRFDDSFVVGENYTVNIFCGNYTAVQTVFIDVPGDTEANRILANVSGYAATYPLNSLVAVALFIVGVSLIGYTYRKIRYYR